jgi:hypothetical protein
MEVARVPALVGVAATQDASADDQFDQHVWFDGTRAVTPLSGRERGPARGRFPLGP